VKKQTIHSKCLVFVIGVLVAAMPAAAQLTSDDFESYTLGENIADYSEWWGVGYVVADPIEGDQAVGTGQLNLLGSSITSGSVIIELDLLPVSDGGGDSRVAFNSPVGGMDVFFYFFAIRVT
jgi:hypothetical protein